MTLHSASGRGVSRIASSKAARGDDQHAGRGDNDGNQSNDAQQPLAQDVCALRGQIEMVE
eukprot:CAMPEP_0180012550 /NCGR_PEP_ID=MMETSP0984-20121128/17008_1 /TAXON_ID=483367 /ORGANISM="non described non described, Strain CCMP 2436" /LENGTH=59 /DNA_ID=CAMNT_0021934775 /DNA_START=234 /DNA_END=414 /DNA_ORIENTATION=-